jgi:hypothetical protein
VKYDEPLARFVRNLDAPASTTSTSPRSFVRHKTEIARSSSEQMTLRRLAAPSFTSIRGRPRARGATDARRFEFEDELQLLLKVPCRPRRLPAIDIRLVESDEDWSVVRRLARSTTRSRRARVHPL